MATKKKPTPKPKAVAPVVLDPNLPLVHGNTATFVAPEGTGVVMALLETSQAATWISASNGGGGARVSWIVQVSGPLTVGFYSDGDLYAEGTFTVS